MPVSSPQSVLYSPCTDERSPLLSHERQSREDVDNGVCDEGDSPQYVSTFITGHLYVSHFLSTWNSRVFEFGSVLYLATIFPGTLVSMSVYALVRGLAAIIFAPAVGMFIDKGNRLQVVRVSIGLLWHYLVFYLLIARKTLKQEAKQGLLALFTLLACAEKLCSIMNLVSVEKDWVVVIAKNEPETLRLINAQMRRIDLVCKLVSPLFIALVESYSTPLAIITNFAMNVCLVAVEYFAIARVYKEFPKLKKTKNWYSLELQASRESIGKTRLSLGICKTSAVLVRKAVGDFGLYFGHKAFLPSFAGAMLYLTVLNFAGQMVTYLLSAGYCSARIGVARTFSVAFEVLAKWIAPWMMGRMGVFRAGIWLSSWQVTMLAGGMAIFWCLEHQPLIAASGFVVGTILSRLGLRGLDLCVQLIVQEEVEPEARGAFSSVEAAWQNAFELTAYTTTIIFSQPKDFRWPSLMSLVAVALSSILYANYALRKHSIGHFKKANDSKKRSASRQGTHNQDQSLDES